LIQEKNPQPQRIPWPVKNMNNIGDNYAEGAQIRVRCIDPRGVYYNFTRRRQGDVFTLIPQYVTEVDPKTDKPVMENGRPKMRLVTAEQQFSPQTMEKVEDDEPEKITTAQMAINKMSDELNEAKIPTKRH
jgi:hypothetical protein